MRNTLLNLWLMGAIDEVRQSINANEKELRMTKEKKSTLSLALKGMIKTSKLIVEVYENAIKENEGA